MGTPPDGTHGPHVFVANLENPELEDKDHHHFERVLRLRPGSKPPPETKPVTAATGDANSDWFRRAERRPAQLDRPEAN